MLWNVFVIGMAILIGAAVIYDIVPAWILVLAGMVFGAFIWPTSSRQTET